jgi:hypothetical protein
MSEAELLNGFTREILAMERGGHRISIELSPAQAVQLVGQLQLAQRHPGNAGHSADIGRWFISEVQRYFKDAPAVLETIRLGWEETL